MVSLSPAKILIGISLDSYESKELLSWAISVLAHPSDYIVAVHILGKHRKNRKSTTENQSKFRRAKASVISLLGEFSKTCQDKQVSLEARVNFSSRVERGLFKEARLVSANYLVLGGSRSRVTKHFFRNAPNRCTIVLLGNSESPQLNSDSDSTCSKAESHRSSSRLSNKSVKRDTALKSESENPSPRTVLSVHQSIEDENSSYGVSTTLTDSMSTSPNVAGKSNTRPNHGFYPCTLFSLLGSPFRKRNSNKLIKEQPLLRCFSYEEIAIATDNFNQDKIVGRGGYSEVYKGDLSNGQTIAVKRLAMDNNDSNKEKEFLTELGIIGHLCHPNTASLVGCCIENGLYLIFNFSHNGCLASALHGKPNTILDWSVRYKIAIGIARGLHYLHKCCKHRIIHRDIKASNVLLGPDYEPQITDFGLAKWLPNKWTHHAVIPIEGTFGYLAPEYFMHGIVDEKTDVYAFGVLLLEIVTGRRPVDSSDRNLLLWAKPLMESGDIDELVDPNMEGKYDSQQLHNVILTASYSVRQSSIWRPSMTEILELLTNGHDSKVARSWRFPKFTSDDLDDYSMVYGYDIPSDISLEDSFSN